MMTTQSVAARIRASQPFTLADVGYLANFSVPQLRQESRHAHVRRHVADFWRDTQYTSPADAFPWTGFAGACEQAIRYLRSLPATEFSHGHHTRIDPEAVKAHNDIVDVVGRYVDLRQAGHTFKARCPFHNEKTPSFVVNPDRQTWHCFGACGTGGDVISFVMKAENCDFLGAVAVLEGKQ